jgi:hypothetical protein
MRFFLIYLFDRILSLYDANQKHNDRDNQEHMNEPSYCIHTDHAEKPQDQKNYCNICKHKKNLGRIYCALCCGSLVRNFPAKRFRL